MTINTALSINCFTFQQEVARLPLPEKTIDKINYSQYSKCLTLEGEELQYLPEVLACCHHIQRLVLKGDLEFLPDAIGQCHNLKELCFSYNKLLKYVPDAISQCRELEVLKICKTELESLPDAIGNCHNLRELSVNSSKLKHLPITIGNCRELTMLSIENSELKNVPDMLGNCQNLRKICLDYNQLECLPENLGNCVSLEKLTFICNKVKDLPLTLDNCKKLTSLQLDYNQFEYLPEVVSNCTNLQFLGMLGNNWKSIVDITLSLSTMTSLRVNGLPPFVISEKKSPSDPTTNNKSSYDIVIVNPVHKGFGDYELGRKIQALVTKLDYSVKLQMTTEEPQEGLETRLIIVTPYSIEDADDMQRYIKNNFRIKQNTKVLMIDEMDAVQTEKKTMQCYRESLQKIFVGTMDEIKLGFSTDSVGYLSMTRQECEQIQQRSRVELEKLFDSFNITFDPSANYYVSYLNSERKVTATQIFMFNTLRELQDNPSSVNYICSLGETAGTSTIIDISNKFAQLPVESFSKNASEKFSKMNLMIVDVHNKKIFQKELASIGNGAIPINVIFLSTMSMPKRVWHNFIAVSKAGMMTGDQSLTDYLSIKQEMPFYETQRWKKPLEYNILKKANDFKGEDFKEYVTTKFVGQESYAPKYKVVDQTKLTDELRNNFRDFGRELAREVGNYACAKKIIELVPKKSICGSIVCPIKKLLATV